MAAIPAARSLLHPYAEEPLPLYTPRHPTAIDPETSSIHSSAPSYTSAAPSYHSAVPPSHRRSNDFSSASSSNGNQNLTGSTRTAAPPPHSGMLSSGQCAPGFQGYMRGSSRQNSSSGSSNSNNLTNNHLHSLYNISEWVPVTEGLQARHYHNVAKRRVTAASAGPRPMFPLSVPTISEPPGMGSSSRYSNGGGAGSNDVISTAPQMMGPSHVNGNGRGLQGSINPFSASTPTLGLDRHEEENGAQPRTANSSQEEISQNELQETLPISPHEDPDLVGEAAAARYRSQRLYMTAQQQQNQQVSTVTNRPAPYSSLLPPENGTPTPTQSTDRINRPSSSPNPLTQSSQSQPPEAHRSHERHRSATTADEEEALRMQEAKMWDFMMAQMVDWEERERSWKKFKQEVDKRVGAGVFRGQGLRLGLGRGFGGSGNGKGKLRKTQSGDPGGGGGGRKWMGRNWF
ncbi:hypothetical protein FQN54_002916 [Arachnomyces sp. PD_36]|nr:hypothetical protein FQN54_002916 [Arachnomyces sp. PD_36]